MIGAVICGLIGIVFLVVGFLIWKKEKLSLLHEYHRDKVLQENQKAFCALSGWGVMTIGIGLLLTACVLGLTDSAWSFIAFFVGFAVGLALLIFGEKKYN